MRILVIPDVHLKPWMFWRAEEIMEDEGITQAVCLMDIADDWRQEYNLDLYAQSYDAAISFAKSHPETLWCYGNHDVCYLWDKRETGYSGLAKSLVCKKLGELKAALPDPGQLTFIHRVDNVLFSHGGLITPFLEEQIPEEVQGSMDELLAYISGLGPASLWKDVSPLWARPQYWPARIYKPDTYLQVVGHTPLTKIERVPGLISCDVFSTDRDRNPIGTCEFLLLDTLSWEHEGRR